MEAGVLEVSSRGIVEYKRVPHINLKIILFQRTSSGCSEQPKCFISANIKCAYLKTFSIHVSVPLLHCVMFTYEQIKK